MLPYASVRTLILGIDPAGRIVQHDHSAPSIIASASPALLGARLQDIVVGPALPGAQVDGLLDAAAAGREATAVLALRVQGSAPVDAVVSVQPMRSSDPDMAALVILRVPPASDEQFLDPGRMRHALLDDTFRQIGATLDLDQMARGLINIVVPHFCNVAGLLMLESLIAADEPVGHTADPAPLVRRLAFATDARDRVWDAAFPTGEVLRHPAGTPHAKCLETGEPVLEINMASHDADVIGESPMHGPVAQLMANSSLLVLPLTANGTTLGILACIRRAGFRPFDAYDTEIGMEFAARAAIFIDNARRYNRERATALTLQRSLLPTGLSAPSSVEVGHRYLPGSQLIEVGGDWYESIALPGARVALVVGDVAGHGVRAAVTMGRLRTAIQTLARLELPPAESLQQLDELMQVMGWREPHFATCVYAAYDAVNGTCEVASAGHLPPLLVAPDGTTQFLDVSPAPPLGVGDGLIRGTAFDIEDGSLLILYTDGLVESRGCDIEDGLARLRSVFGPGSTQRPIAELCRTALTGAYDEQQRDDIAVLVARLSRIDPDQQESWELPDEPTSAGQARALVRGPLQRWGLDSLLPTTQLLVSELVTNAIRYTDGPVVLRLIREGSLVCEVHDCSAALPRLRHAARDDECGRGLEIVSQMCHRWGTRRTVAGKVVWAEQELPQG